jgi:hypothetical protein
MASKNFDEPDRKIEIEDQLWSITYRGLNLNKRTKVDTLKAIYGKRINIKNITKAIVDRINFKINPL